MKTKIVKRYLRANNDELSDFWDWHANHGSLYEVVIDLEVDMYTGKSRIVAVDGIALVKLPDFV